MDGCGYSLISKKNCRAAGDRTCVEWGSKSEAAMLNRCLSSILLRLLALVSRWLKKPLHRYVSFKRDRPFLTLGLTGKVGRERQFCSVQILRHEYEANAFFL